MALLNREQAIAISKSYVYLDETRIYSVAKDIVSQSYSFDDVLRNIQYHLRNKKPGDTFIVSILHNPFRDRHVIAQIGSKNIVERVQKLLEEKYREAFPEFPVEKDLNPDADFTFYLRITL